MNYRVRSLWVGWVSQERIVYYDHGQGGLFQGGRMGWSQRHTRMALVVWLMACLPRTGYVRPRTISWSGKSDKMVCLRVDDSYLRHNHQPCRYTNFLGWHQCLCMILRLYQRYNLQGSGCTHYVHALLYLWIVTLH